MRTGWIKRLARLAAGAMLACVSSASLQSQPAKSPMPPVHFTPLPVRPVVMPVMACDALPAEDLLTIEGAPARISSATLETRDNGVAFCRIKGMIAPQIQFELHLPMETYTGRYLQGGCGGACGVIYQTVSPSCDNQTAFSGAFAVSFNNSGHVGPDARDTLWAAHAPQLRADFAYRAAHVTARVAKEIIARFYGRKPAYSYFMGCSNGGREAMMEAQRYPEDFDGIIAGAPALSITPGVVRIIHESQVARGADGQPILTPQSTQLLHRAVMAACDGLDGLKDGQIDNPRRCRFDPRTLVCKPGQRTDCVSAQQAETMHRLYEGPRDAEGRPLFFGGEPYGSELLWTGPGSFVADGYQLAANQIKFMIYNGETHQDFDWRTWKPDAAALADLIEKGGYYNASNPDLAAFKARGGKLIMWQGEADNAAGSWLLPDYYQRVRNAMGGFAGTDPFMRVYMFPGVYHCAGGYIGYQHDLLGPMVNWVERGAAPGAVEGAAILKDGTVRRRPTYPFPVQIRYTGRGDINAASSFAPVPIAKDHDDRFDWVGAGMEAGPPPAPY
ncbi:feruloyl esterase [Sphingobium sp. B2D3A]|uniref:tannase/feruloyl esterase family alpha/beta hydrolase n=1 Tax=unclassified Sphingobium TaxID=2611147 RepID=UPI0022248BF9|nr:MULTISPECIES: tannase/feruloyl esterase family alpha/beta hydrolase [unclassified Sphingobium]MCW2338591.1 feruloyl esterase [Sphingobium sp. B2D3A]MCW2385049.1 feruloyl esterase [Sphingobium sp. B2D3D]